MDRSEVKPLLHLAVPAVLANLAAQGMMVVDTIMIASYGKNAIAGASLALLISFATLMFVRGAQRGMDPLVSQAFGAGEREMVGRWTQRTVILGIFLAIPVILIHLSAGPLLRLLGQPPEVIPLASQWARIFALGLLPIMAQGAVQQFLQAIGQMRPVTTTILVGNLLNVGFNLIFMRWLGAVGCAWSTALSEWLMFGICLFLSRDVLREWWPNRGWDWAEERAAMIRLFWLGIPVGIQQGLEVWGFSIAGIMVGWKGETSLAAHMLCVNLASISFMMPLGIGVAAGTRVGNLLGAEKYWGHAAWTAVVMGAGVMGLSGMIFSFAPTWVLSAYGPEPLVLSLAAGVLPIAGAFQLFDGIQAVSFGVLRGAGDLKMPAVANVIGYYLVGLPLGFFLSESLGVRGIWIGLTVALATVAFLLLFRIRWTLARGGFRLR